MFVWFLLQDEGAGPVAVGPHRASVDGRAKPSAAFSAARLIPLPGCAGSRVAWPPPRGRAGHSFELLVTGGRGFAGATLWAAGRARGPREVDVLDPMPSARPFERRGPGAVVHLAALASVAESWSSASGGLARERARHGQPARGRRREHPEARVLVVSTAEVYGPAEGVPTPEDEPPAPLSPYGASKAAAEPAAHRPAGPTGSTSSSRAPSSTRGRAVTTASPSAPGRCRSRAAERGGGGVLRSGNLDVERDLTDVRDVCRAYRLLLDRSVPGGHVQRRERERRLALSAGRRDLGRPGVCACCGASRPGSVRAVRPPGRLR